MDLIKYKEAIAELDAARQKALTAIPLLNSAKEESGIKTRNTTFDFLSNYIELEYQSYLAAILRETTTCFIAMCGRHYATIPISPVIQRRLRKQANTPHQICFIAEDDTIIASGEKLLPTVLRINSKDELVLNDVHYKAFSGTEVADKWQRTEFCGLLYYQIYNTDTSPDNICGWL